MKAKALHSAFLIIVALLVQTHNISAQVEFWTTPLPISDSVSDNRNAIIKYLFYNDSWDNFIFWERSLDSNSTEIYSRNFYTQDEPVGVVTGGNYHFTNPQIIFTYDYSFGDTLFYLFYQSDQNGNADIFYKVYTTDGYTEPQLFAGTSAEESHFRCNDGGSMVWQEDDKIKFSQLTREWNAPFTFSDPVTIDSNNCSSPEIPPTFSYGWQNYITWLKKETDSASVWYSAWDGSWSEPILLFGSGNNESPGFAMSVCPYMDDPYNITLSWENISGNSHTIYAYRFESDFFTSEFHQENDFLPMIGNLTIPVEDFSLMGLMTFVNSDGQNDEIYISDDFYDYISPYPEDYVNLSQSPYRETNPKLFNGTCPIDVCDLILTWESYRNEHWQLFYSISEIGCYGGIADQSAIKETTMNISPNPARNECDINYTINEDASVSIQLCTLDGRQLALVDMNYLQKGTYTYHLNFDQIFPGSNYSGMFMVRLQAGGSSVSQKVIKMQ